MAQESEWPAKYLFSEIDSHFPMYVVVKFSFYINQYNAAYDLKWIKKHRMYMTWATANAAAPARNKLINKISYAS